MAMNRRSNPFYPPPPPSSHPPYVPGAAQAAGPPGPASSSYGGYWNQGQYPQPAQSQWQPAQPASAPSVAPPPAPHASPEHASLYANYGYGGSHSLAWNNQAHNQHAPPPPAPTVNVQATQAQAIPIPFASAYPPAQPPPQHPSSAYTPQQPQYHPAQPAHASYSRPPPPPPVHHPPPPVKRPRYDPPPPPPPPPHQARFPAPPPPPMHQNRPPLHPPPPPPHVSSNLTPLGGRSGGGPGVAFMNGNIGGRGGGRPPIMRGGMANGPMNRTPLRGRGGAMVNGRPMMPAPSPLRGSARMHTGGPRRQPPRGGMPSQPSRSAHSNVSASSKRGSPPAAASDAKRSGSASPSSKRDDARRTFTDFKIVGLELRGAEWLWGHRQGQLSGVVVDSESRPSKPASVAVAGIPAKAASDATLESGSAQNGVCVSPLDITGSSLTHSYSHPSSPNLTACRFRIYFHNPKLDGGSTPSGDGLHRVPKRKKADDDEDSLEAEGEQRARRPLPPHILGDREMSVSASVTGTEPEEDWLMAAMQDGTRDSTEFGFDHASVTGDAPDSTTVVQDAVDGIMSDPTSNVVQSGEPNGVHEHASPSTSLANDSTASLFLATDAQPSKASSFSTEHEGASASHAELADSMIDGGTFTTSKPTLSLDVDAESASGELEFAKQRSPHTPSSIRFDYDEPIQEEDQVVEDDSAPEQAEAQLLDESSISWNRISIAYEGGLRRLIVDSTAVEKLTVYRAEGRIELKLSVNKLDENQIHGVVLETLTDKVLQQYSPIPMSTEAAAADSLIPSLMPISSGSQELTLLVYLDTDKPLSAAKWVKTGDLQEWLRTTAGKQAAVATPDSWIGRVQVNDPDPPPSIHTLLEAWTHSSGCGTLAERKSFVSTQLSNNINNILEILLRMVRSDRAQVFSAGAVSSTMSEQSSNPLADALSVGSPLAKHQTHVSLAVLAMFKMLAEQAKALGTTDALIAQIGEIVRSLPQHQLFKSLDMMFKDMARTTKKTVPANGKYVYDRPDAASSNGLPRLV